MIQVTDKHNCCGCSACVQACPKQCITLQEDAEGFLYPKGNTEFCLDCHLCEKVCPCLNRAGAHEPQKVFAAINPNEKVRMQSSSGGVFSMLAEATIKDGGVVFGARFDQNWNVIHDYTESIEELTSFRGSKYVQSVIGNSYIKVKEFLQKERKVLFSGTPCQIAGLKLFLRKEYTNLLTLECVCHSVPSPGIWKNYLCTFLKWHNKNITNITEINFRNKITGWEGYSVSISFNDDTSYICNHEKDRWMRGFISGLYSRPSCSRCPAKANNSRCDIELGDLWGNRFLLPEITDNKGICVVLVHTDRGQRVLEKLNIANIKEYTLAEIASKNPAITQSCNESHKKAKFYSKYLPNKNLFATIDALTQASAVLELKQILYKIIKTLIKI